MWKEDRFEFLLILLSSYLIAFCCMSGKELLIIPLLTVASIVKIRDTNIGEVGWYAFIGALMAFLPIVMFVENYQDYLPPISGYTYVNAILFSLIITTIFIGTCTHFPGVRKDIHIFSEILLLLISSALIAILLYLYGYYHVLEISLSVFIVLLLISLLIDTIKWRKIRILIKRFLEE